ncbi:hypothetical protein KIPB_014334, partial [Kipferlia bialata]|eukprot:g14334.t1
MCLLTPQRVRSRMEALARQVEYHEWLNSPRSDEGLSNSMIWGPDQVLTDTDDRRRAWDVLNWPFCRRRRLNKLSRAPFVSSPSAHR